MKKTKKFKKFKKVNKESVSESFSLKFYFKDDSSDEFKNKFKITECKSKIN